MRARRIWRWATRRWSTKAPSSCSAATISSCASSPPERDFEAINDYVAWILHASQAIAIKVVNPGGISAFKFNQRKLDLDEEHVYYHVTPRQIILALARAREGARLAHPLHVHGSNLGVPGNMETTLATIRAAEGLPLHLTHIQFHSYGTEGDRHFSSGAPQIAELVNKTPNISIDVGQVMFGQTCTASGDSMRQYAIAKSAHPKKRWSWISSATPAAGSCPSATATRAMSTRCNGPSASRCFC